METVATCRGHKSEYFTFEIVLGFSSYFLQNSGKNLVRET